MEDIKKYKIKIEGQGVTIDQEIDALQLSKIIPIIISTQFISTLSMPDLPNNSNMNNQATSLRELINEKFPKTNPQKITVVAYYLRDFLNQRTFSLDDIKIQFERAAEPIPQNLYRDLKQTVFSGWISESAEIGKFFLTTSGESAVQGNFTNKTNSGAKKKQIRLKGHSTALVAIRPDLEKFETETVLEDFGNYWKISKKGDRVLWILAVLNEKGFKNVNFKEIALLTRKLGDNIPAKNITALMEFHKKNGRVAPFTEGTTRVLNILKPGVDYVKELSHGRVA